MVFDSLEHLTSDDLADQERRWQVRAAVYSDRVAELESRIEALKAEQDQFFSEVWRCHTNAAAIRLAHKMREAPVS